MPYELFWRGDIDAFDRYYQKAQLDEQTVDRRCWQLGLYMNAAICQSLSGAKNKKSIYPKEPYLALREKEKSNTSEDKAILLYKRLNNWAGGLKQRRTEENLGRL